MTAVELSANGIIREITCHGTTIVRTSCQAVINLAGCGITIVVGRKVLVAGCNFLPMNIRIEIANMMGIAMTKTCGAQSMPVVVYHH